MKVNEIFCSIQGETSFGGFPFTFIRLTGCNLRCLYCDTQYAYEEGRDFSVDQIVCEVSKRGLARVAITGGEPLLQEETFLLTTRFLEEDWMVLLETNGSQSIRELDTRIHKILDLKCPGSGMNQYMDFDNLEYLGKRDELKFVICSRTDFEWASDIIAMYGLPGRVSILFSPAYGILRPRDLARWIIEKKLDVRMQLQLHKYIWPRKMKGV